MPRDYGKYKIGGIVRDLALIFKAEAPLDDRSVVIEKGGLLAKSSFGDADKGTSWMYRGMTTTVQSTGETYVLRQKPAELLTDAAIDSLYANGTLDSTIALYWDKIAKASDVQTLADTVSQNMQQLAGVFQFKGVADAIDADHTTITLKSGTKTVSGNDLSGYVCNGFYYDVAHDKYYEWTKDSDTIYVKGTEVYTKSGSESSTLVYYVDYADSRYYAHDVSNNKITSFQSLDGGIIYPAGDGVDSETATTFYADSSKTVSIGSLTPHSYPAYTFTLVPDVTFSGSAITPGEGASGNNGHVYQIGEKEYASNGLIWVELGSPKQEINWLVL